MAGIYLHIPFCKKRCIYCDFFSSTKSEKKTAYIDALCQELELRRDYLDEERIETIYFGGGTPSQLAKEDFERIFSSLYKIYPISPEAEITLEANPDDLSPEYIHMLRTLPFNRLSMGIQTFNENTLKLLQRRHTAQQAIEAFTRCREAGFHNISIDLMYGLPGETMASWEKDLQQALEMKPEHISAYHLIYEEGTPLWKLRQQHQVEEVEEDLSVSLFTTLIHRLKEHGYQHYEISNFSLPGFHSRHNSSYWTGKKYLGCGASSHSYNGHSRQWNVASIEKYIQGIEQKKPEYEIEELDLYTRYNDFVITTIRTSWGMPLSKLKSDFGDSLYQYCLRMAQPHLKQGKLEITNHVLRLTESGIFVSDGIMSDMLWVED
ncbi:radical SAM family heme chaperone HemW [Phocaeicola sp. HCN-40430]|uniref:radical SAM family heme chaperone HemW n=1 Tax=Phocaeicola sp. HCN-40430 TaxID=3134664 RepID=UPI0030BC8CE7